MPLTPVTLGGIFLGERLSATDIAGALIIAAALIIIDGRVPGALRRSGRGLRLSRGTGGGPE
jgi:drug/metabolite transporter (DMT)-like permease